MMVWLFRRIRGFFVNFIRVRNALDAGSDAFSFGDFAVNSLPHCCAGGID
jgi:hypothetical protein